MEHQHDPEGLLEGYPDCEACQEVMALEASLDPEDLVDLRINSIVERYNHAFRSDNGKMTDST